MRRKQNNNGRCRTIPTTTTAEGGIVYGGQKCVSGIWCGGLPQCAPCLQQPPVRNEVPAEGAHGSGVRKPRTRLLSSPLSCVAHPVLLFLAGQGAGSQRNPEALFLPVQRVISSGTKVLKELFCLSKTIYSFFFCYSFRFHLSS